MTAKEAMRKRFDQLKTQSVEEKENSTATTKKVTVEMVLNAPKKCSVRYEGVGEKPAVTALYVMNAAVNELGEPIPAKRIRVTIERIE